MFLILCLIQTSMAAELKQCTSSFCATVTAEKPLSSKGESIFSLELKSLVQSNVVLKKIDLWMDMGGHGHGSAPLKVTPVNSSVYNVKNAYFVMKGTWLIRVTVQFDQMTEKLEIPVRIDE